MLPPGLQGDKVTVHIFIVGKQLGARSFRYMLELIQQYQAIDMACLERDLDVCSLCPRN